ncbi:hypothetical protein ACFZAM_32065 [Streptomyces sp. NPDC008079]|uniref:hypothetical protein n=1 Tax=Streptomyces sp. NPDC008079 TaxID=3364806 RepID=UPI0036ECCE14
MADLSQRRRQRHQWHHPALAELLGIDPVLLRLVQMYLEYRCTARDPRQTVRLTQDGRRARLYDTGSAAPRDLIALPSGDEKERLTTLLGLAVDRQITVEHGIAQQAEMIIGHNCGRKWETIADLLADHRTATAKETAA